MRDTYRKVFNPIPVSLGVWTVEDRLEALQNRRGSAKISIDMIFEAT